MATDVKNTWQQPSPMPLFPLVESMTAAEIAAIGTPVPGMLVYNSDTNKLNFRAAAAWEVVTSL